MAISKIVGIETEYGIIVRGAADWNPVSASSQLINAYVATNVGSHEDRVGPVAWDFADEMPGSDARVGGAPETALPPEVETHLVNAVLTNGARFYVDHAHPELSTPECRDALSIVLYDRAAELIVLDAMAAAARNTPGQEIIIYKDNTDRKGNSYGCHENYLLDRERPFGQVVAAATTHFVSRQIFTGSGKVGTELAAYSRDDVPYQLSQRAEHFEEEVGLETTLKRPIVNTRDEPHADSSKYRRLHVITGDANMSQVATFLKVGTSAIVFAMLEDDFMVDAPVIADPVRAMHRVSHDVDLVDTLTTDEGVTMTALEVQWDLLARANRWAKERGLEAVGETTGKLILERWEEILSGLETDPMTLAGQLDWVAKKRLLEGFMARHDCDWDDTRLRALDLQYHDLRPQKSLASRVGLETLVSDEDARVATTEPPTDTRAYFRGRCLQKFADQVVAANWDSIVFDVGDDPLRRVPMLEPSRGTVEHVGTLLDNSETVIELLEALGA